MLPDVFANCVGQFGEALEYASSEALFREVSEEAFHHVEPGGAGRSEVKMKARMFGQPTLNSGLFVSRVVVHNEMQILPWGRLLVNEFQELQPLLMTMPVHLGADDGAIQRVQRGKQGGGTVSFVVMSQGPGSVFLNSA